jgi:hypothetical protein
LATRVSVSVADTQMPATNGAGMCTWIPDALRADRSLAICVVVIDCRQVVLVASVHGQALPTRA